MLSGSCLCGGVKYEVSGGIQTVTNCHCSLCRKMSGSAFASGGFGGGGGDIFGVSSVDPIIDLCPSLAWRSGVGICQHH